MGGACSSDNSAVKNVSKTNKDNQPEKSKVSVQTRLDCPSASVKNNQPEESKISQTFLGRSSPFIKNDVSQACTSSAHEMSNMCSSSLYSGRFSSLNSGMSSLSSGRPFSSARSEVASPVSDRYAHPLSSSSIHLKDDQMTPDYVSPRPGSSSSQ